jgi:hypothetical protein
MNAPAKIPTDAGGAGALARAVLDEKASFAAALRAGFACDAILAVYPRQDPRLAEVYASGEECGTSPVKLMTLAAIINQTSENNTSWETAFRMMEELSQLASTLRLFDILQPSSVSLQQKIWDAAVVRYAWEEARDATQIPSRARQLATLAQQQGRHKQIIHFRVQALAYEIATGRTPAELPASVLEDAQRWNVKGSNVTYLKKLLFDSPTQDAQVKLSRQYHGLQGPSDDGKGVSGDRDGKAR